MNLVRSAPGRPALIALAVLLVGWSLPFWLIQTQFILVVAISAVVWAIAAQGWNIAGGYGGLLSFGHSVYFGIGAYTTALLTIHFGLTPWVGMLVGALAAALAGAITTFPALRLKGTYFTLATFVLTLLFADFATHFRDFTGGDVGLSIPFLRDAPEMFQFDSALTLYYVVVAILAVVTLIVGLLAASRLGLFLRASRDDPDAARAAGVDVTRVRLVGLSLSAAVTGVGGGVMLQSLRAIDPVTGFGANTAFVIALVALTGGRGTVVGPIVGAAVLIPVQQILSAQLSSAPPGLSGMAYAVVVAAVMLVERRGLVFLIARLARAVTAAVRARRPHRLGGSPASGGEAAQAATVPAQEIPEQPRSGS
ncbi:MULTISPECIES: branched-chain amino acid ABC transporter permease [unclassified Microbispora]|uniref:branched-chain amino acid ABC transporter permease n=1 Tax=Microbispora TaxID=2005 RepID=UPI00143930BA|nr:MULTISPECIES: branched-chain amino acid ABC transporter permease [unclassified Microbispora]NJP27665.1 branched-chain amino acid ABC transporter permease [Microbispora sp. CL1-1]